MAKDSVQRLLDLQKEIENAKLDKATVEGGLKLNLERLKTEFGVRGLEQAKAALAKKKERKETILDLIDDAAAKLEENYSW